jgi:thioesterase domain-containing protein
VDHLAAVRIENPEAYPGKITLFRPLETGESYRDPTLGWSELATEGVDVVWTPGNHETMFLEGNVEKFGQLVQEVMDPMSNDGEVAPKESAPALHSVSR